jgi:hypothetical protein
MGHTDSLVIERLSRYGYGVDCEMKLTALEVPEEFQRKLRARNWDDFVPALFGRLLVAEVTSINGKKLTKSRKVIVDGQHRAVEAMRQGMEMVPCLYWEDMAMEDAAAVFDLSQSNRVALPPADEFRSACWSQDARSMALDEALLERGLDGWSYSGKDEQIAGKARASHNLRAIASVRKLENDLGLEHTCYTLDVIQQIWPWDSVPTSPHVRMIRGFGQFLREEKFVESQRGRRRKLRRRWNRDDTGLLVAFMQENFHGELGLDNFLRRCESAARGGGGGGGSLGCEWELARMLSKARKDAEDKAAT